MHMHSPPADDEQHKDVYAYAGLALYWAQCFEMSLSNTLLLHERATNIKVSIKELESLESALRKRTLGGLLNQLKKMVALDPKTTEYIDSALEKRNFLAHHFFQDRATLFFTSSGRAEMIDELISIKNIFVIADTSAMALCGALGKSLGISNELLDDEFNRMFSEVTGS